MVRVLLGFEKKSVIQGNDLFINGQKFPGTSVFNVRCGSEEDSGASFVEYGAGHRSVGRMEISSNTGVLRLNEQTYRDRFSIIARGSSCMIVNVVELEKYLSGVIGKEMSPSWPLEALKAQAVAAR